MLLLVILYFLVSQKAGWGILWFDWVLLGIILVLTAAKIWYLADLEKKSWKTFSDLLAKKSKSSGQTLSSKSEDSWLN